MKLMEDHIDFETSLGPWIGKTAKLMDYYLLVAFQKANLDLTKEQMVVLKRLHDKDGLNQNELAYLTYRDKSSLARLLSKMESKGYLKRSQNAEDKRINEVYLTQEGKIIYRKTRPVVKQIITTMEAGITEDEKEQFINTLQKVQHNFESS